MRQLNEAALLAALMAAAAAAHATGAATCDSGPQSAWQAQEKLAAQLKEKGWEVRRIKVDGGCYEVYATDDKGKRVEEYFHPVSLAPVPKGAKNHKG
jgi:hypothetical protein